MITKPCAALPAAVSAVVVTALCVGIAAAAAHAQTNPPPPAPGLANAQQPPAPPAAAAAAPAVLVIDAGKPGAPINPMFYGLMTEEINHAYDGGLYAELIQNRQFKDDPAAPAHWSLVNDGGEAALSLDSATALNAAQSVSLKLTVRSPGGRVGIANDGYWGIPVKPATTYTATFWAKASAGFGAPLIADIESADGKTVYASAASATVGTEWKRYSVTLATGGGVPSSENRFVLSANKPGTVNFSLVSLMPPTYKNRPNGNRVDLMEKMAAMQPAYLRLPGGNYLEGDTIDTRFDWKKTIGPVESRPGHQGTWKYRSDDGLGLLEFLNWCQDLKMEPLLAVYAGYSLSRVHVTPGTDLQPFVQDALDEIEYVTGDKSTKWGAERARDGHPEPFPLHYIEIGNEDQFDRSGSYDARFTQFFDAIRAKYPQYKLIATTPVKTRQPDLVDDHFYRRPQDFYKDIHHYDNASRTGPKIFIGEWASQEVARPWIQANVDATAPTPNLDCALGDAAWMTGMERNADLIEMNCYAPLLVNVNSGGRQWATNLIGYDALTSYGSPSYYAQIMFAKALGNQVVPAALSGGSSLFESVTRDTRKGMIYVKVVNARPEEQSVHVTLSGLSSVKPQATVSTLRGSSPSDTNTLTEPEKIVPVTTVFTGSGASFDYRFLPFSVTVIALQGN